jgi:hypothetical protein
LIAYATTNEEGLWDCKDLMEKKAEETMQSNSSWAWPGLIQKGTTKVYNHQCQGFLCKGSIGTGPRARDLG